MNWSGMKLNDEDLTKLWEQVNTVRDEVKKLEDLCQHFFGIYISTHGPWKNPKHKDYEKYHSLEEKR